MPKTEKKYPDWVQKQRRKGTTVKEKGGKASYLPEIRRLSACQTHNTDFKEQFPLSV